MTLQDFIDESRTQSLSLVLVNYDAPNPLRSMFEGLFENQSVDVTREAFEEAESNMVYLVDNDDGVIATSPLSAIRDTILLTNPDQWVTGKGASTRSNCRRSSKHSPIRRSSCGGTPSPTRRSSC